MPWLMLWAIAGALGLCLLPVLRGSALAGLTVPFWLIGAPLVDIVWLTRARWLLALRAIIAARRSGRPRFAR